MKPVLAPNTPNPQTIKLEHFGVVDPSQWLITPNLKAYSDSMGVKVSLPYIRAMAAATPPMMEPFIHRQGRRFKIHKQAYLCWMLGISSHPNIQFANTRDNLSHA